MGYGSGMGWGWLFGVSLLLGLVLLGVVAVRLLAGGASRGNGRLDAGRPPQAGRSRAREVLDERLARGEISPEEYRERRQVLDEDG